MKSVQSVMKQLFFCIMLLLGMFATQKAEAGPIACAACLTVASAPCVAGCVATGPAYLACVMACEVQMTYTVCIIPCTAPTP